MAQITGEGAAARGEAHRDQGLIRAIGPVGLSAAFVNIIVGGGIYALPGGMAAAAGPYAVVAYIVCALATLAVVACCAEAGSRVPTSGGIYGYVDAAYGPLAGFVAGVFLWLSCVLACGGIAAALAGALARFVPALAGPLPRAALIVGVIAGLAGMNMISARTAARAISWATAVKLLPLLLFVVVGLLFMDPAKLSQGAAPSFGGLGRAMLLCLFAFQGMETVLGANGEVANPQRTLPRALVFAMTGCAVLYIAIQVAAQGLLGAGLPTTKAPLAEGIAVVDPRLGPVLLAGMAISLFAWMGSDLLGAPRMLFAFARDGFLPAALGRLSGRGQTPAAAIAVHGALAAILAITGTFEQLAVLAALAGCLLYVGACLAAWTLKRRGVALLGQPLNLPGLPVFAVVGTASMAAAIFLAKPVEIAATAATVVASIGLYWIVMRRFT